MTELLQSLGDYGAIGLIAIVALGWAYRLYRDLQKERQRMDALRERYITKAETWMNKYHDMAKAQTSMLEAFERRYGK